ncbi:MAG TPA: ankyrin repeat domain-containing protein [Terracidiphilus sp.]|nr:ankyrin repeat domain-containing protein [Terracidiphilus sp.]
MPEREIPLRPNLEQYKKQAKDLARACGAADPAALARVKRHHPRFAEADDKPEWRVKIADAQLVIAREHGFDSWPKFAAQITTLNLERHVTGIDDPVAAFIRAACVPRNDSHSSGTLEEAEMILTRYPQVARTNIHTAAIRADEDGVRAFLARDPASATVKGGPENWDALTHLCFSRYLRLDKTRGAAFVRTARALLDAGSDANTGWWETIDLDTKPRQIIESAIYGAAGIAHHAELTRLLLEYGADPNDEETAYHAAEEYDLGAMKVLVESGKLSAEGQTTLLLRKADWHDTEGIRWLLEHGADPNAMTRWRNSPLHHAVIRDNQLRNLELMLQHGGNFTLKNGHGVSAAQLAARRGRGDVLRVLAERGIDSQLEGEDRLIAACAVGDDAEIRALSAESPDLVGALLARGGTLLVEFAGTNNAEGVQRLLELGVDVNALHGRGDGYWDVTPATSAPHNAAWRGWTEVVKLLIARGATVNAVDSRARTPLALAVKACVDSYWKGRRTPESVDALLKAGATTAGIEVPCGYDEVDELLFAAKARKT